MEALQEEWRLVLQTPIVRLAGRFFPLRVKREPLLLEHGEETLRVLLFRKM